MQYLNFTASVEDSVEAKI